MLQQDRADAPPVRRDALLAETEAARTAGGRPVWSSRLNGATITEGRAFRSNNEPAHIGQRIQFGDQIKVNGKPI